MMMMNDSHSCDHDELRCDATVFDHLHFSVNSQIIDGIETSLEVAVNKPSCLVEASGNHTNVGHRDLQPEVVSANSPVNDGSKVNSEVALESPRGAETVQIPPCLFEAYGCCKSKGKQPTSEQPQENPAAKEEPEPAAVPEAAEHAPEEHKQEETCTANALKRPSVPLKVTIVSARGLRNADWVGKSDPYCICEVSGRSGSRIETKVVTDNLSPEWHHEAVLTGYCAGDELHFIVKDKDPLKTDDPLGSVTLATGELIANGFEGELALTGTGAGDAAHLTVKAVIVHPVVKVTVIGARGLRNADWVGKSDPYCICEVPGKPHVKFQTPAIDEQLNPEWHHTATVPGYCVEDPSNSLLRTATS